MSKRYVIYQRLHDGSVKSRTFKTREARDEAVLAGYRLMHRSRLAYVELRDPDGFRVGSEGTP